MAHGIKEDKCSWMSKSGELLRVETNNGSTGSATDTSKYHKSKRFYYNFTLENLDSIERQAHYEVRANGIALVNWTGNISRTEVKQGYVDFEYMNFTTLTCQAYVVSNQSRGYAYCNQWEELV